MVELSFYKIYHVHADNRNCYCKLRSYQREMTKKRDFSQVHYCNSKASALLLKTYQSQRRYTEESFISLIERYSCYWQQPDSLSTAGSRSGVSPSRYQQQANKMFANPLQYRGHLFIIVEDNKASCIRISKAVHRKQGDLVEARVQFLSNKFLLPAHKSSRQFTCVPELTQGC